MKVNGVSRLLTIGVMSILAGCGNLVQVEPWEKGNLAKPEMTFDGDRLDANFTEHTYRSKEAAFGGSGVGGGGCGCN